MTAGAAARGHVALRLTVRAEQEDAATGLLWELEPSGLEILAADRDGRLPIVAYFLVRAGVVQAVREHMAAFASDVEQIPLPDVDWAASFRQSFRAFGVGGFRVVPCWEELPRERQRLLVVDPGRAFGTGTHETTRLCLGLIESLAAQAPLGRVLDVGTGTGILALAALRCGARHAIALDNDPEAVASARTHARLNALPLDLLQADGTRALQAHSFDLVLANLMAPLLLALRDELADLRTAAGRLVLSGLLTSDLEEIRAAFAPLGRLDVRTDGEWAAVAVHR